MNKKLITVGIPAFKAENHIAECLSSIMIQSIKDEVSVIIASDNPKDDYSFTKQQYPKLDITILSCEKNTGPGLARQRALDACKTDWITFIDADDVFATPFSLENLKNNISANCIEVQGPFLQEVEEGNLNFIEKQQIVQNGGQIIPRYMPRNDVSHPWVFGRLYNVPFLRQSEIKFSTLRAMEDGELNFKIHMLIEGTPLRINLIQDPVYLWRTGSEHSITRTGIKENGGTPLYNYDLCLVGATAAAINAIKFCKSKNPFNGGILKFTTEQMVGQYFSYIQCLEKKPIFAEQCLFNAKRFYHSVYKEIENQISDDILKTMYTMQYAALGQELINIIPQITFFDFMKKIKTDKYEGKKEFDEIRSKLPKWVIDLDKKTGVLGEEGYVYTVGEQQTE